MGSVGGAADGLSVLVSLIVILGLVFAAAALARRWRTGAPLRIRGGEDPIRIITARTIGWQSSLQIVEAEGQRFLIGASRAGITAIGRLTPPGGDSFADLLEPRMNERAALEREP
jgi:flagellar biogenesis protein FliO